MVASGGEAKVVAKLEFPAMNAEPATDHAKVNGDCPPAGVQAKRSDWSTSVVGRDALTVTDRAINVPAVTVFEVVMLEVGDRVPQPMQSVVSR
jgi:hypothetical protein